MSSNEKKPNFHGLSIIKEKNRTKNSVIYLVKNETLNKITILKSIKKSSLDEKSYELLKRERDFYSSNKYKDIFPSFINTYKDNENLYIEMSFIEGVNFSKLLTDEHLLNFSDKSNSNFNLYLNFISQIIYSIYLLHMDNYSYRDLKLNNLIINKKLKISLIDFGFIKKLDNTNIRTTTICGTFHMKAPEIILLSEKKLKNYNPFCSDIYSIGVIMYEIYYGKPPFKFYNINDVDMNEYKKMLYKGIDESFFDNNIDNDLKESIIKCMNIEPEKRPKVGDIISDKLWEKFGGFEKLRKLNEDFVKIHDDEFINKFVEYISFSGDFEDEFNYYDYKKKMDDLFADF